MSRFTSIVSNPPPQHGRPEALVRSENISTVNITTANGSSITITGSHIELEVQNLSPPANTGAHRRPSMSRPAPKREDKSDVDDGATTVEWSRNEALSRQIEADRKIRTGSLSNSRASPAGLGVPGHVESIVSASPRLDSKGTPLGRMPSNLHREKMSHERKISDTKAPVSSSIPVNLVSGSPPKSVPFPPNDDRIDGHNRVKRLSNTALPRKNSSGDRPSRDGTPQTSFKSNQTPNSTLSRPIIPASTSTGATPLPILPRSQSSPSTAETGPLTSSHKQNNSSRFGDLISDGAPPIISTPPTRRPSISGLHHFNTDPNGYFPSISSTMQQPPRPPSPCAREEFLVPQTPQYPILYRPSPANTTSKNLSDSNAPAHADSPWKQAPLPASTITPSSSSTVETATPKPKELHHNHNHSHHTSQPSAATSAWVKSQLPPSESQTKPSDSPKSDEQTASFTRSPPIPSASFTSTIGGPHFQHPPPLAGLAGLRTSTTVAREQPLPASRSSAISSTTATEVQTPHQASLNRHSSGLIAETRRTSPSTEQQDTPGRTPNHLPALSNRPFSGSGVGQLSSPLTVKQDTPGRTPYHGPAAVGLPNSENASRVETERSGSAYGPMKTPASETASSIAARFGPPSAGLGRVEHLFTAPRDGIPVQIEHGPPPSLSQKTSTVVHDKDTSDTASKAPTVRPDARRVSKTQDQQHLSATSVTSPPDDMPFVRPMAFKAPISLARSPQPSQGTVVDDEANTISTPATANNRDPAAIKVPSSRATPLSSSSKPSTGGFVVQQHPQNPWRGFSSPVPSLPNSDLAAQDPPLTSLPTPDNSPPRTQDHRTPPSFADSGNLLGLLGVSEPTHTLNRKPSKLERKEGSIGPSTPPDTPRMMAMQSIPVYR